MPSSFILDRLLPAALNYETLKNEGIEYLKVLAGHQWSNYNDSDPGVTILEQLCYALTELGYCAQFPIEDVLTQADGHIHYHEQFFQPQEILTTAPVTLNDYRILVVDQIEEINNLYLEVERDIHKNATGRYRCFLYLADGLSAQAQANLPTRVLALLNQYRNLGEVFYRPETLREETIYLAGEVLLNTSAVADEVYKQIVQTLRNYVSPRVQRRGYKALRAQGLSADQIFNGPELKHGWISGENPLGDKRETVRLMELSTLIAEIEGVKAVLRLQMQTGDAVAAGVEIKIPETKIAVIEPGKSLVLSPASSPSQTSRDCDAYSYVSALQAEHQASDVESGVDCYPPLPQGQFRDISTYYSIQHTFPDIYAVGENSLESDAPDYRVGQSRQLKAYLLLFDQLLANQFSQLAHLGDLFSFYQHSPPTEPVDTTLVYQPFTTTYFSQPLYNVPDVRPLLRGHQAYEYQFDSDKSKALIARQSWERFKRDPFNQYHYGLRQKVENEQTATSRRNRMLTHLLARQGEAAATYEEMIKNCQWYDSESKTQIIVKSLWLQNYQLLSYRRTCGYNFAEARSLTQPGRFSLDQAEFKRLQQALPDTPLLAALQPLIAQGFPDRQSLLKAIQQQIEKSASPAQLAEFIPQVERLDATLQLTDQNSLLKKTYLDDSLYPPRIDGTLDQTRINAEARLHLDDFYNFSAFALRLALLLGLKHRLNRLAAQLAALLHGPGFEEWADDPTSTGMYVLHDSDLRAVRSSKADQPDRVFAGQQCLLDIFGTHKQAPKTADYQAHLDQLHWLAQQQQGFLLLEHILLVSLNKQPDTGASFYYLHASLLFPGYVTLLQQLGFRSFVEQLIADHWPAHVRTDIYFVSFKDISTLIPPIIDWHNLLRCNPDALATMSAEPAAQAIVEQLQRLAASEKIS